MPLRLPPVPTLVLALLSAGAAAAQQPEGPEAVVLAAIHHLERSEWEQASALADSATAARFQAFHVCQAQETAIPLTEREMSSFAALMGDRPLPARGLEQPDAYVREHFGLSRVEELAALSPNAALARFLEQRQIRFAAEWERRRSEMADRLRALGDTLHLDRFSGPPASISQGLRPVGHLRSGDSAFVVLRTERPITDFSVALVHQVAEGWRLELRGPIYPAVYLPPELSCRAAVPTVTEHTLGDSSGTRIRAVQRPLRPGEMEALRARGTTVDTIVVEPLEIRLRVGERFEMPRIRYTAHDAAGNVVEGFSAVWLRPRDGVSPAVYDIDPGALRGKEPGEGVLLLEALPRDASTPRPRPSTAVRIVVEP